MHPLLVSPAAAQTRPEGRYRCSLLNGAPARAMMHDLSSSIGPTRARGLRSRRSSDLLRPTERRTRHRPARACGSDLATSPEEDCRSNHLSAAAGGLVCPRPWGRGRRRSAWRASSVLWMSLIGLGCPPPPASGPAGEPSRSGTPGMGHGEEAPEEGGGPGAQAARARSGAASRGGSGHKGQGHAGEVGAGRV